MLSKAKEIIDKNLEPQIQNLELIQDSYAKIQEILGKNKADFILLDL